jgi:hypothetical protein
MSATSLFRFLIKRWEFAEQFSAKMVNDITRASIRLLGSTKKCNSYYTGYFNLENVPLNATLTISYIGYEDQHLAQKSYSRIIKFAQLSLKTK